MSHSLWLVMLLSLLPLYLTLDPSHTSLDKNFGKLNGLEILWRTRFLTLKELIPYSFSLTFLFRLDGRLKVSPLIEFLLKMLPLSLLAPDILLLSIPNFRDKRGLKERKAVPCKLSNFHRRDGLRRSNLLLVTEPASWLRLLDKKLMLSLIPSFPEPLPERVRISLLSSELKNVKLEALSNFTYSLECRTLITSPKLLLSAQLLTSLSLSLVLRINFWLKSCVLRSPILNKLEMISLNNKTNSKLLLPSLRKTFSRTFLMLILPLSLKTLPLLKV